MRRLIFALVLLGGYAGGGAVGKDRETAAILCAIAFVLAGAGAWLLYARVDRRRG